MTDFDTLTERGQRVCAAEAVRALKRAGAALPHSTASGRISEALHDEGIRV